VISLPQPRTKKSRKEIGFFEAHGKRTIIRDSQKSQAKFAVKK
jgi:hypothetical protein